MIIDFGYVGVATFLRQRRLKLCYIFNSAFNVIPIVVDLFIIFVVVVDVFGNYNPTGHDT